MALCVGHFFMKMKILNFFNQNNISLKNKKLVVAASGGPDSMALVDMLCRLNKKFELKIIVAHFDHQLRSDSDKETSLLQNYCDQNNLLLENGSWPVNKHPNVGLEAAAREARYTFLIKIVKKYNADYLLTAHHGDDLLENILLKLIRSGNPQEMNSLQMAGKMQGITLLRPLVTFSKKELLDYDHRHNIAYIEDSTNQLDDTMRNRIRHHVVPLLKKENSRILENALRYSIEQTTLTSLANQEITAVCDVEPFLEIAYRLKENKIKAFTDKQKLYFWRSFIWKKWHRRVNDHLTGYDLINYQGYFYLVPNDLPKISNLKEEIILDKIFTFRGEKFFISQDNKKEWPIISEFWSASSKFYIGSISSTDRLLLKDGHHVKPKKKFAQAKIPALLRAYCLSVFDENGQIIFVEKTFKEQVWQKNGKQYFLYQLKNV